MSPGPLRIVYMGTPDFAVPALEALLHSADRVVGVVTQPDKPSGRGKRLTPPPVKVLAEAHGLPVYQPPSVRTDEALAQLAQWAPDVIVVAAYGKILPRRVLDLPPHGCLNIHASLLPKYRGAAPINWAIVRGEEETGVTIMQMDVGLDTGPMLLKAKLPMAPLDTAQQVHDALAQLGADAIVDALMRLKLDSLTAHPQDDALASWAPMLAKEMGAIDWSHNARDIANLIRGFNPWPGAYAFLGRPGRAEALERIKCHLATPVQLPQALPEGAQAGQVLDVDRAQGRLVVATGQGALSLLRLQAPGRREMTVAEFLNGFDIAPGDRFLSHDNAPDAPDAQS